MGPGNYAEDFADVLDVFDWVRKGLVLVHKETNAKGRNPTTQGADFVNADRHGDYFYLCNGNLTPSILLLGQFNGPANYLCERGDGWTDRPFRWIRTSQSTDTYSGQSKWWTPNHNSTFVSVPDDELSLFEREILVPYFNFRLDDFGIEPDASAN